MAKKKTSMKMPTSLTDLERKYEGSGLASEVLPDPDEELWVPSSSVTMNYRLGGGACYGRIMEIAGQESSGKTLLSLDLIAMAQRLGGVGIFIDAELAFNGPWAIKNGIDLERLTIFGENAIEIISDFSAEAAYYWRSQLTENQPIVMVFDSVAAMDTIAAMETSAVGGKEEMGRRAKVLYAMIRHRNKLWARLGITVIFINQLRSKINTGFGAQFMDPDATPGGNALKFYASQRLFLESKKQITVGAKERKRRVGVEVMVKVKKNKLTIPKAPARTTVIFDPEGGELGFDRYDGIGQILVQEGAIEKRGNSYYFDGELLATSKEGLEKELRGDEEQLTDILAEAGLLNVTLMQERIDDQVENRYPVTGITFATGEAAREKESVLDEEDDDE